MFHTLTALSPVTGLAVALPPVLIPLAPSVERLDLMPCSLAESLPGDCVGFFGSGDLEDSRKEGRVVVNVPGQVSG
jgi:hypothetical protein